MKRLAPSTFIFALFVGSRSLFAQPVQMVPEQPSCATCQIVIAGTQSLRANAKGDGAVLVMANGVAEDSQKRMWILGDLPMPLFSDRGVYARSFGAKGRGPNEYQMPVGALRVPGDSLVILDASAARVTVLDRDLEAKRTIAFPYLGANGALVLHWPDSVIVSAWIRTPTKTANPLHIVSLSSGDVTLLNSFGTVDARYHFSDSLIRHHF